MKKSVLMSLAVAALTSLGLCPTARADIAWTTDLNWARSQAMATGKPIMIDFYTDWCHWCKKLDSDVYPDAQVQNVASNFIMVRLDAERGGEAAANYFQVTGYPTLLFLSPQYQYVGRVAGYLPAQDMTRVMNQVLAARPGTGASMPSPAFAAETHAAARASSPPRLERSNARAAAKTAVPRHAQDADAGVLLLDDRGVTRLSPRAKPAVAPSAVVAKASSHKSRDNGHKAASKGVSSGVSNGKPVAKAPPPAPPGVLAGGVVMSDQ